MNLKTYKAPFVSVKISQNFSVRVDDYHEFGIIKEHLENIGLKFKYEECGCDYYYEAVFWLGKKPVKLIKTIKDTYKD